MKELKERLASLQEGLSQATDPVEVAKILLEIGDSWFHDYEGHMVEFLRTKDRGELERAKERSARHSKEINLVGKRLLELYPDYDSFDLMILELLLSRGETPENIEAARVLGKMGHHLYASRAKGPGSQI
ncbi:hypothetical protein FJZ40_03650 [Candidatus Shapirobacteria bacterium]|nr:hypothetical protein [Candidatus Shapirobacteria bacterium]